MRVWELGGSGLDTLAIRERSSPRPARGQVLVRMRAASLNHRDLLIATGRYGRAPVKRPLVPLSDGAGEVVDVGPDVQGVARGDRVAGNFFQGWVDGPFDAAKAATALGGVIDGVLAEEVVLESGAAVKLPASLSFEEGATLPCAGVTSWVGLMVNGQLAPNETVLAMGTGGVSVFALQIAKMAGARVVLTSSSDEKLARGTTLGADEVINYRKTPEWDVRARELTGGHGVDHLLEVGGAASLATSLRAVRDGGHLSLVGLLGGVPADLEAARANRRGIRVDSVYVGSTQHLAALAEALARSGVRPVVDRVFAFEDARAAYEHLGRSAHFGKVVVRL